MPTTLICLVSQQAMANVIPALEIKANKVILLRTDKEKSTAENIRTVLENNKIKTEIFPDIISPYNLNKIKKSIEKIISDNGCEFILNVTGGTKIMAITAFEVFKEKNKKVIYYDPEHHCIINLLPENKSISVNLKITIRDYLLSYGYSIKSEETFSQRAEDKQEFLYGLTNERFVDFIEFFDFIRRRVSLEKPSISREFGNFVFSKKYDTIKVSDKKTNNSIKAELRDFKFGDWLEDYLYLKIKSTSCDDIKYGVKLGKDNTGNEVDILFTKNCKLYLVSCKTGNLDKNDFFELDGLRKLAGGTFGKAFLLYTGIPNESLSKRAKSLNVEYVNAEDISPILI